MNITPLIAGVEAVVASTFWTWDGWTGLAALAQIVAALSTLGALIFFWAQIQQMRSQQMQDEKDRREDFELAHTPYLSLQVLTAHRPEPNQPGVLSADCQVNADGAGVAYDVKVTLRFERNGQMEHAHTDHYIKYLRAPDSHTATLSWNFGIVGPQDRAAYVEFEFVNMFHKKQRYGHRAWINDAAGLRVEGAPEELPPA